MKFISGIIAVLVLSCHQMLKPKLPDVRWDLFDSPAAMPLKGGMRHAIEGIYGIEGENNFGPAVALKWSYTMSGKDTLWHLSMFCEASVYFICEGKKIDSNILLKGYWRRITTRETGTARFVITPANGAAQLLAADTSAHAQNIAIEGSYGKGDDNPDHPVHLRYIRPLYNKTALEIVAHRGGGRIGDLLPASENSVELIVMASRLGATGVEIDVQITKDGVPVLYHDDRINHRLTKKTGVQKKLSEYSYAELSGSPLKNGEKIPTLQQALYTIVHHTPLQYIWLDAKDTTMMEKIKDLQFQTL